MAFILPFVVAANATTATPAKDAMPYAMILRILDETGGRYEVEVQDTNPQRFVSGFTWTPPPGLTINAITKTIGARCQVKDDNTIACTGLAAPANTAHGVGTSLIVDFSGTGLQPIWAGSYWIHAGLIGSVQVHLSTFSDLPLCKQGQHSTKAHPCAAV